jgi:hypothetical protein
VGTKFRTMLAPIGMSTGDGRRFQDGAITLVDLPMPFEWARSREGGHDGAVSIGAVQEATVLSVADAVKGEWIAEDRVSGLDPAMMAVWGKGEMFDGVDREEMPRLAEDTAEALHLITNGTLGPSVDLDSFEAVPVLAGTDDPVTWEDIEAHYEEHGEEPKIELLVTAGRVRAATLVSIPAYAETSRPLELIVEDGAALVAAEEEGQDTGEARARLLTLVASVSTATLPDIAAFTRPTLPGPTPITWDYEAGRVYGHIATWRTCHVGFDGVCITPPRDDEGTEYASFNRFPVETADGVVWAGRLTVGGRHAGLSDGAARAMSVYDGKDVVAWVRAYSDEHGIVVSGVIHGEIDARTMAILDRRKVSGDWRETAAGLSLIEVLALSPGPKQHSEPGFPVETFSRAGRQVALVASLSPDPETTHIPVVTATLTDEDIDRVLARREQREAERKAQAEARRELHATLTALPRADLVALVGEG